MVYLDRNRVRAGLVRHRAQWPWCSYGEWMGQRRRYGVVDPTECLQGNGLEATMSESKAALRPSGGLSVGLRNLSHNVLLRSNPQKPAVMG
jgi:hypothetical protein